MDQCADFRCRSGKACPASTSEGAALTAQPETICTTCVFDIQRQLRELPPLRLALRTFLGVSTKVDYESKVSSTPQPGPPMNTWVFDLVDEIDEAIDRVDQMTIARLVQEPAELFHVWVKDVHEKHYLDGVDRAMEIRRVHTRVCKAVGLHPVWEKRGAPCPHCNEFNLGTWLGADLIECTTEDCPARLTLDEYEQYCLERVKRESDLQQKPKLLQPRST